MPKDPTFELFEAICQELAVRDTSVMADNNFDTQLIDELKVKYGKTDGTTAVDAALATLSDHFYTKATELPFAWDVATREFNARDKAYMDFISFASSKRGCGGQDAKEFEVRTMSRLSARLTGALHHVGTPRQLHRKKNEFEKYLRDLGFDKGCLGKNDQDGGFDIVWLPPLGSTPLRPLISLQCKNSSFSESEANKSTGRAFRTMQRHSHIRGHNHMFFVIFNDYIDASYLGKAQGWIFIPLGLSDLAQQIGTPLQQHVL
jgi:hypothetical protein